MVFCIDGDTLIDVETIGDRDASYEDYVRDIQKAGTGICRYGLFDYEYLHQVQGATEVRRRKGREELWYVGLQVPNC